MVRPTITVQGPAATLRAEPAAVQSVSDLLSPPDPGAAHTFAYKSGRWDGKVRLMSRGVFLAGLVPRVVEHLRSLGLNPDVLHALDAPAVPICPSLVGVELRPHQASGADAAIAAKSAVLESPTASGKTILGAEIARRLGSLSVLWLCHRDGLAQQTRAELSKLIPRTIGLVQGKTADWHGITVGMIPSLAAKIKAGDPGTRERLKQVRVVIADEAHHGAADTWQLVVLSCENATYRFGLTGTLPERDPLTDLKVEGLFGPKIVVAEQSELEAQGFVATPTIRLLQPPAGSYPRYEDVREHVLPSWRTDARPLQKLGTKLHQRAYQVGIVENARRSDLLIQRAVMPHYRAGEKVLLMADLRAHAADLAERARAAGAERQWLVDGETKDRDAILARFRDFAPPCLLVVTPWFREGMDLPEIDVGVMAGSVESEIAVLQAAGRMLRVRPDKQTVLLYCCLDGREPGNAKDYLAKHSLAVVGLFQRKGWHLDRLPQLAPAA